MFLTSPADPTDARNRLNHRQRQIGRATFNAPPHAGLVVDLVGRFVDKMDDIRLDVDAEGPLLRILPVLNWVLCALLGVVGTVLVWRGAGDIASVGLLFVPGLMVGLTGFVRRSMVEEQREIGALRGMRYGYKGA